MKVTKALREMLEKRKSPMAKKVSISAYYQPDFKRGESPNIVAVAAVVVVVGSGSGVVVLGMRSPVLRLPVGTPKHIPPLFVRR